MPAENQTVQMPAGDSRRIVIPVKDQAGADLPLTGATVRWWMAKSAWSKDADVLIKKTTDAGISVSGSTATVMLAPADTDAIPPGAYYHEAEIVFADQSVATVSRGTFQLSATVIRQPA
jgi:hypothetical protein